MICKEETWPHEAAYFSNSQVSNKVFWITKEKEKDLQKDEKYQGGVSLHFPCQKLRKMPKRGARKSLKMKKELS